MCGSTRVYRGEDEAEKLLAAWQQYRGDALLAVVPRHPEHFQTTFETAKRFGFKVQRRSDGLPVEPDTQVWIGDSMGELYAYYLCADVAFVGGSLVGSGCQNIIEPLSCGVTTIFGFSTYNFSEACRHALASGAAVQVESADAWREAVEKNLSGEGGGMQMQARVDGFIAQHRGAGARIAEAVREAVCGHRGR